MCLPSAWGLAQVAHNIAASEIALNLFTSELYALPCKPDNYEHIVLKNIFCERFGCMEFDSKISYASGIEGNIFSNSRFLSCSKILYQSNKQIVVVFCRYDCTYI